MESSYVRRDEHGVMRVGQTHVMLDSVIAAFQQGHSPETIRQQYPALSLEAVYGAITYYLAHPQETDAYLQQQDQVWQHWRSLSPQRQNPVVERLRRPTFRDREATVSRPRFLADNDVNEHIVDGVLRREPAIQFVRLRDLGLGDSSDADVSAYAASAGMIVISHDVRDVVAFLPL